MSFLGRFRVYATDVNAKTSVVGREKIRTGVFPTGRIIETRPSQRGVEKRPSRFRPECYCMKTKINRLAQRWPPRVYGREPNVHVQTDATVRFFFPIKRAITSRARRKSRGLPTP